MNPKTDEGSRTLKKYQLLHQLRVKGVKGHILWPK